MATPGAALFLLLPLLLVSATGRAGCERLTHAPPARSGDAAVVTDAEAAAAMRKGCKICHAQVGELSNFDVVNLTLGFASATALTARKLGWLGGDPQAPPCASRWRRLITMNRGLWGLAAFGLGHTALLQSVRSAHTRFLHRDGTLNEKAFARPGESKEETLLRVWRQVHGDDGREYMPPRSLPRQAIIPHYTEEDHAKLEKWLGRMQATDLPPGCQQLAPEGNGARLSWQAASAKCDAAGMYLPTAPQVKQLAEAGGCWWTSSFSEDPKAPRLALVDGQIVPRALDAGCAPLCLR